MAPFAYKSIRRLSMNLEDYTRLHAAMDIPTEGTGSLFRELLEKILEVIIRVEREAILGVSNSH